MSTTPKRVNGHNFLYEYLQHGLRERKPELFHLIVRDMVTKLGIWLPFAIYQHLPILLPHVIRDASCRANKKLNREEQWGSSNAEGFLRDDNSLIKGLVGSLDISSPSFRPYRNRRRGGGFWAAHVWSQTSDGKLATEDARTNSFLPNLVWLPANVAKLTDATQSYAQQVVQALSLKLYREVQLPCQLKPFVEESWDQLTTKDPEMIEDLADPDELNYFRLSPTFLGTRLQKIEASLSWLRWVCDGRPTTKRPSIPDKVLPSRYAMSLEGLDSAPMEKLMSYLDKYVAAVRTSMP